MLWRWRITLWDREGRGHAKEYKKNSVKICGNLSYPSSQSVIFHLWSTLINRFIVRQWVPFNKLVLLTRSHYYFSSLWMQGTSIQSAICWIILLFASCINSTSHIENFTCVDAFLAIENLLLYNMLTFLPLNDMCTRDMSLHATERGWDPLE